MPYYRHMCITCHVAYSRCKVNEKANGHTSRGLSGLPLSCNCSQQAGGERSGALHTHPGWEHFMIITIIFPQKIIHRGLCQNWIAQPLKHMVQILCGECGESGRMPLWSCSTDGQRHPVLILSFSSLFSFHFLPQSSLPFLFSVFSTCATNHLYGIAWHLLCFSLTSRTRKFTNGARLRIDSC